MGHISIYIRKLDSIDRQIKIIRNRFIYPKSWNKHPDLLINQVRDSNNEINIEITRN